MGKSTTNNHDGLTTRERAKRLESAISSGTVKLAPAYEAAKMGHISLQYPDFTKQVNAGAEFLDKLDPGWDERLDLSLLDLDDQKSCILGQSWHHYQYSHRIDTEKIEGKTGFDKFLALVTNTENSEDKYVFANKHGFALTEEAYVWINGTTAQRYDASDIHSPGFMLYNDLLHEVETAVWEHLTLTWIMLIKARQAVRGSRKSARV